MSHILKTYILDTNVLLHDPTSIFAFEDNEVVIPLAVIEELDTFKTSDNENGKNARIVIRTIDELRANGNIQTGIPLRNNGSLRIEIDRNEYIAPLLEQKLPDNKIIGVALYCKNVSPTNTAILVSKDINMRVKCDVLGVNAQDYKSDRVAVKADELYTGYCELFVDDKLIDMFYQGMPIKLSEELFPNQFLLLKSIINESKTALARYINKDEPLTFVSNHKDIWGIVPKNKEQRFCMNLLLDPTVPLVSLIGLAGSGKTLLSIAAGLQQTLNKSIYKKIIISRPIQPMGRDIGFLPGTLEEKMNPWIAPLNDNLEFLFDGDAQQLDYLKDNGTIKVEALTYIRGRSIPKSFIIIDEAQNLTAHELKTIVTRVGEGSKLVLTGDVEQIDSPYLDALTNGLSIVVEKFKQYEIAGHVTLRTGVRSELATLGAKIL